MTSLRGHERQEFPQKVRKAAFARCCKNGSKSGVPQCETCGIEVGRRNGLIYEHVQPDGLQGEPTLENCKIHCFNCADTKTHTEDNPRMSKADRVTKKEYGLMPERRQKIQSAGFRKAPAQRSASRPIERART